MNFIEHMNAVWFKIFLISIVMTGNVKSGAKLDTARIFPQTVYIRNFITANGSIPEQKWIHLASSNHSGIILRIFQLYLL